LTKIAGILNSLADTSLCQNDKLAFSQTDIADLAGSSKIQTARVYRLLKESGIITVNRNSILIKYYEKLQELVSFGEL
jgi:CRP-like cAMP-binding protein